MRVVSAILAALLAGCGEGSAARDDRSVAEPGPASGECDRIWAARSGPATIAPGEEVYRSFLVSSPVAGFVTRIAPDLARGGTVVHHLFVTRGAATPDQPLRPVLFAGGLGTGALELPRGVGLRLERDEELELGLHLVNTSERRVSFDAGIELCLVDDVASEADVVSFGPEDLVIPADGREHRFSATCPVEGERTFFAAWPHMHSLGTAIEIAVGDVELVQVAPWRSGDQPVHSVAPFYVARDGELLGVTCSFVNPGSEAVRWGHYARDEMCLAFAYYYPAGLARGWGCAGNVHSSVTGSSSRRGTPSRHTALGFAR